MVTDAAARADEAVCDCTCDRIKSGRYAVENSAADLTKGAIAAMKRPSSCGNQTATGAGVPPWLLGSFPPCPPSLSSSRADASSWRVTGCSGRGGNSAVVTDGDVSTAWIAADADVAPPAASTVASSERSTGEGIPCMRHTPLSPYNNKDSCRPAIKSARIVNTVGKSRGFHLPMNGETAAGPL